MPDSKVAKRAFRILFLGKSIPLFVRKAFFRMLFFLLYLFAQRRRLITLQNLRKAFPEKSTAEITRIARGAFDNLAIMAAEFFDLPFFTKETLQQRVQIEGWEHYETALRKGKGIIALCAHFGNWELQAPVAGLLMGKFTAVYRPLDNKMLETVTFLARSAHGFCLIPKGQSGQIIREHLRKNEGVAILLDQNMDKRHGVFVDFLGMPACTAVSIASLAIQTGATVLPIFMVRQQDGRYHLVIKAPPPLDNTGDYQQDLFTNTQRFTKAIEEVIREYPEQWFWLHQRWKTKQ